MTAFWKRSDSGDAYAHLDHLFRLTPDGVIGVNGFGEITVVNEKAEELFGFGADEIVGKQIETVFPDIFGTDLLGRRTGYLSDPSDHVMGSGLELMGRRQDASEFPVELASTPHQAGNEQIVLLFARDISVRRAAEDLVREGKRELKNLSQRMITAQEEDRARIARDLHDAVTQTILSAGLLADAMVRTAKEGRAIATRDLTKLSRMLRGALDEMRTLLFELRPAAVRDLTLGQLLAPLAEAARARSRAKVNLRVEGDRVLPESVTTHLQRIAQESLNNAIRHAEAKTVDVDLVCDPEGVSLRITDDGRGFDVERIPAGHQGLGIMRERAQEIGAVLEIHSTIDGGTEVSVTWS